MAQVNQGSVFESGWKVAGVFLGMLVTPISPCQADLAEQHIFSRREIMLVGDSSGNTRHRHRLKGFQSLDEFSALGKEIRGYDI